MFSYMKTKLFDYSNSIFVYHNSFEQLSVSSYPISLSKEIEVHIHE